MIKKILVAVDGSPPSRKALDVAVSIAKSARADLTILHVLSERTLTKGERQLIQSEYQVQIQGARRSSIPRKLTNVDGLVGTNVSAGVAVPTAIGRAILSRAKEIAYAAGVSSVRTVLADGDPASTILGRQEKDRPDLLIVGSRGLGGVKRLWMGSVSQRLSQSSKRSVLLVK